MNRTLTLAVVLAVAALFAGSARAVDTYTDAVGDSKTAPDIRQVSLGDAGNGTVRVVVDLDADIPQGSEVLMGIDADRNPATGAHCGCDYMIDVDFEGAGLYRWDGSEWATFDHQSLAPSEDNGRLAFTLTLADLGGTSAFDYWLASTRGDDTDAAPEDGVYTFPQQAAKVEIRSILVSASALLPTAGRLLQVRPQVMLTTNTIVTPESTRCTLSYKGKRLASNGNCRWMIPLALRKKRLVLSVTVGYQGATQSLTLPVTPR